LEDTRWSRTAWLSRNLTKLLAGHLRPLEKVLSNVEKCVMSLKQKEKVEGQGKGKAQWVDQITRQTGMVLRLWCTW